ncbi:hypothetical protein HY374_00850 [Candidatus Berkelbacteria bacterium]|nr:hypothetical protein [Candidatus Berkelbacteria bacterium]
MATEPTSSRPGWHTDAKWVVGIIAFVLVATTAFLGVLARLTEREPAVELLTVGIATAFSPQGIDDASTLEDVRKAIRESPTKSLKPFPGLDVEVREVDLETTSPEELRLRLFRAVAEPIYDKTTLGAGATSKDGTAANPTVSSVGLLAVFSRDMHNRLTQPLVVLLLIDAIVVGLLVYLSTGFGRLASLGWLLTLVSLLPALLFAVLEIASQRHLPNGGVAEATLAAQASTIAAAVAPTVIGVVNSIYRPMLAVGLALILIATIGGVIARRRSA